LFGVVSPVAQPTPDVSIVFLFHIRVVIFAVRPGASIYHIYSYWDLLKKDSGSDSISCNNNSLYGNYCEITPKIWLRDNWGWYSQGETKDTPPASPDAFNGSIVVKE